jgi:hypothetical protein
MFTFKVACMLADALVLLALSVVVVRLGWRTRSTSC